MVQSYIRTSAEILVNTRTTDYQSSPYLGVLANGGFVAVWTDNSGLGGDSSFSSIKAQRFDAAGNKLGAEFLVNSTTANYQLGARVAVLESGHIVVTWTDQVLTDTSFSAEIRGRIFKADGTPIGGDFLVNTITDGIQGLSYVAPLANGGFVATWRGTDDNSTGIKGQLFNAAGAKVGGEFLVNTTTAGGQTFPNVVGLDGGGFAVSWTSVTPGASGSSTDTRLQLFSSTGAKVGSEKLLSSLVPNGSGPTNLAALDDGLIAVWLDEGDLESGDLIRAQVFGGSGAALGGSFIIAAGDENEVRRPAVTVLPDGGFMVVWEVNGPGAGASTIRAQIFDADRSKVGAEFTLGSPAGGTSSPQVVTLPSGKLAIAWTDGSGTGGDASGLSAKVQLIEPSEGAPTDIVLSHAHISETNLQGVAVADLTTVGAINSAYTYAIVSDSAGGAFQIVGDQLQVKDNSKLDYETSRTAELRVRATDHNGNSFEETLKLDIADTPEKGFLGGAELRASPGSGGQQAFSTVTDLQGGRTLLLWREGPTIGTAKTGKAQILDGDGNPVSSVLAVDAVEAVATPGGGFAAIAIKDGPLDSLAFRLYGSTGSATSAATDIFASEPGETYDPSLARLGNGNFAVVWTQYDPYTGWGGPDIFVQLVDSTGRKIDLAFRVNATTSGGQTSPEVAALAGGGFVVAWHNAYSNALMVKLYSAVGIPLGAEFVAGVSQLPPHLVPLANGGFVLVYEKSEFGTYPAPIVAQLFNAAGEAIGGEVSVGRSAYPDSVDVAALGWGGFVVSWSGVEDSASSIGVRAKIFDGSGAAVGGEFRANVETAGTQFATSVAETDSGGFIVSWTDRSGSAGATAVVETRIFTPIAPGVTREGGAGPDKLAGTAFSDKLFGFGGDDLLDGAGGNDTMTGAGGNDIYVVGSAGDKVVESSAAGGTDTVRSAISYTLGANLENLTLTGAGTVNATGNALANILTGNAAANLLSGGAGADTMNGGGGNDIYVVDNAGDKAVEASASGGLDKVKSSVSYTLGANVEELVLTGSSAISGTGNGLANAITGNAAANALNGAAGNDVLDGKGGNDTMSGGAGNDSYFVGSAGDKVVESSATGGFDTVNSAVSFTLGANLENLFLTGAAVNGTGNGLVNRITGNAAANLLDGKGGADTMTGAGGNDGYVVDNVGDKVVEAAGGGVDTVTSSVGYTLAANVEKLVLTGTAVKGIGNELANRITGNAGANTLDGKAGADTMTGGKGNDTYVASGGDVIVELAGEGIDTVQSSTNFALPSNVEKLLLTGTAAIGTGNSLANTLTGNASANTLDGKAGADAMAGGKGDDTYFVDNAGDTVAELSGEGIDTVNSSVSFSLAGQYAEKLVLTGSSASNGTGNGLANILTGNAAANILKGSGGDDTISGSGGNDSLYGGAGKDSLKGGAGQDGFYFDSALGSTNIDALSDFARVDDTIYLSRAIFTKAGANGALAASAFVVGTAAADADDRIVYNAATGKIYYDADGSGGGAALLFATVVPNASLNNLDFVIYG